MIKIDDEFKNLIPPLTDDEYKGLEESILKEGCRDSLVTWNDILIDGHNRYEICVKHGIAFQTTEHEFENRQSVIEWIILNQFSRRNITAFQRSELALKLKPVIAQKAKERQYSGINQYSDSLSQKSVKPSEHIDTQKEIAKAAGVSHDTIAKVEKIKEAVPEPIIQATRQNDISINSAYQVTKLEPEEQQEIAERIENIKNEPKETSTPKAIVQEVLKRPHVSFNSGNNEWYTPKEYIEAAYKTMGVINLDPASNEIANRVVKAEKYYTAEENGLEKTWNGNIWLNPPYSSDLIGKFADKLLTERGNYTQAIVLVNNATETEWFNKIVSISSAVCFPKGRVKFYTPDGKTGQPLQGQAVLYIGDNPNEFINAFAGFGWRTVLHGVSKQ